MHRIDGEIYRRAMGESWSADLCSQFRDYEDYRRRGLGVAAMDRHILAAGASSYTVYKQGIEIEVDTRQDYRRKGLALCCAAQLILDCSGERHVSKLGCPESCLGSAGGKTGVSF